MNIKVNPTCLTVSQILHQFLHLDHHNNTATQGTKLHSDVGIGNLPEAHQTIVSPKALIQIYFFHAINAGSGDTVPTNAKVTEKMDKQVNDTHQFTVQIAKRGHGTVETTKLAQVTNIQETIKQTILLENRIGIPTVKVMQ